MAAPAVKPVQDPDAPEAARKPFGFGWFVPQLLKYKALWRDVLLASVVVQLMALATPLFTQVSSIRWWCTTPRIPIVSGVALPVFTVFTAIMNWVRQYPVLHTGIGTQVFAQLFKLPTRYFEQRPTGVVVARLHGVEQIREFVSGLQASIQDARGARAMKRYHPPMTPYERLLHSAPVSAEGKERLRAHFTCLDPIRLLKKIRVAQAVLFRFHFIRITLSSSSLAPRLPASVGLVARSSSSRSTFDLEPELAELSCPGRGELPEMEDSRETLEGFLRSLSIAWQKGEVRPTHLAHPSRPVRGRLADA